MMQDIRRTWDHQAIYCHIEGPGGCHTSASIVRVSGLIGLAQRRGHSSFRKSSRTGDLKVHWFGSRRFRIGLDSATCRLLRKLLFVLSSEPHMSDCLLRFGLYKQQSVFSFHSFIALVQCLSCPHPEAPSDLTGFLQG